MVADFLSRLNLHVGNEEMVDDQLPDEHLFPISTLSPQFSDIENYLVAGKFPPNLSLREKINSVRKKSIFNWIGGNIFRLGPDKILRRCVREEVFYILSACHDDPCGSQFFAKEQPLKFYSLVIIGPPYIKMQGDIPLDVIIAKELENPHPSMKLPYNLKWP